MFFIPSVSAETVSLISNTDFCTYDEKMKLDYCEAEYEIEGGGLKTSDVDFIYKTNKKNEYKSGQELLYLDDYEYEIEPGKIKIKISAYKEPYIDIDHVLCYDDVCNFQYEWWNGSFNNRVELNASHSGTLNVTIAVLVNGTSGFVQNGYLKYDWCVNLTVTPTNTSVGYYYYNATNENHSACTDLLNNRIGLDSDEGNSTEFLSYDRNTTLVAHMNGTGEDHSLYRRLVYTQSVPTRVPGTIGYGMHFDGSADLYNYSDPTDWIGAFYNTITFWFRANASAGEPFGAYTSGSCATFSETPGTKIAMNYRSLGGNLVPTTTSDVEDNVWHFIAFVLNGTTAYAYYNGVKEHTVSNGAFNGLCATADFCIGANCGTTWTHYQTEAIDDFRVFNESLTDDQIMAMFNSSSFIGLEENFTPGNVTPPTIPNITFEFTTAFCYDDDYLYHRVRDITTNGSFVINEYLELCEHGCDNFTIWNLGNPGCEESIFVKVLYGVIIAALSLACIRWLFK